MSFLSINLYSIPLFVTAVLFISLGVFVYFKNKKRHLNQVFFCICLTISVWLGFSFLAYNSYLPSISLFWFRFAYMGITFIPFTFFHYVSIVLDKQVKLKSYILAGYIIGFIFCVLIWNSDYILSGIYEYFWGYYPRSGRLHWIFLSLFFTYVIVGGWGLSLFAIKQRKNLSNIKRSQIFYIIAGFSIFNFASLDFLPNYGIELYPTGYISTLFFVSLMGYAIIRYRLMGITLVLTRTGIFLVLYTAVFGLPFYLGYRTKSWVLSTSFAFIFGTIGPVIFRMLQKKAEDMLLFQQRRYQSILLQTAGGMVKEHRINRLFNLIVYMIKKEVKVKFAVIFSYDKKENLFRPAAASRGYNMTDSELIFHERSLFIQYLKKTPYAVIAEEMPAEARVALVEKLKTPPFALLIPSLAGDRLLSFLVLGEKEDKSPYSQDDINVFNILARQTALAIENCLFFEEFKKVQKQLFQAEKLASIGGIADGVAHQIKNRLNHFSLASGEIKLALDDFVKNNPEFTSDEKNRELVDYLNKIVASITGNVRRTDGIIRGILNYARTEQKDVFFNECSLEEMINAALDLLAVKHALASPPVKINLNSVRNIWGVRVQLNEVLYNLIDNAYESTKMFCEGLNAEEKGNYRGEIFIEAREKSDHWLIIISDNGIGIKDEDRPKMFAPFFTTKSSYKSGSGIGMYVAKRIIEENHKGELWFESEYLKGTSFFVKIPFPEKSS